MSPTIGLTVAVVAPRSGSGPGAERFVGRGRKRIGSGIGSEVVRETEPGDDIIVAIAIHVARLGDVREVVGSPPPLQLPAVAAGDRACVATTG